MDMVIFCGSQNMPILSFWYNDMHDLINQGHAAVVMRDYSEIILIAIFHAKTPIK